ncbi:hypothetical protein B0H13DRAFT_2357182 [Mycena leptocephala]|nr:hypothetical protein B0H13DRAFT_2357182 [Mycena leptocephala]
MSTPVNPLLVLSDSPLNKKLIGELQSIAVFMKLDATLKKDALLRATQRHIKENPELADNSHLLPLFAHRPSPKKDVKTSAAKAAEEEVEGKKPQPAATGANKILLAHNAKTDPPRPLRSFRREGINTSLPSPSMKTLSVVSYILHRLTSVFLLGSDSSVAGDPVPHDIVGTPEPEIKGETVNNHQGIKGIIHVNFYGRPLLRCAFTPERYLCCISTGTVNMKTDLVVCPFLVFKRAMRRQQEDASGSGPELRVELPALGDTPDEQVAHTFKAKTIYCLQWACGCPVGWGNDYPQSKPSFIAYDDACSLLRHIVTQNPNSPWIATTEFIVDAWHYIGHRATDILCRLWCNPAPLNGSQLDLIIIQEDGNGIRHQTRAFNTATAE